MEIVATGKYGDIKYRAIHINDILYELRDTETDSISFAVLGCRLILYVDGTYKFHPTNI